MREEFLVMTNTGTYNRAGQLYEQLNDEGRLLLQAFVRSSIETNENPLEEIAYFKKLYKTTPCCQRFSICWRSISKPETPALLCIK